MRNTISVLLGGAALAAASIYSAADAGTPVGQRYECRSGSVLVGFQGHIGVWIDQFQPLCAPWNPTARKLDPAYAGDTFGNLNGGSPQLTAAVCLPGSAVIAINYGRANPNGPPGHVQNLDVQCAPITKPQQVDSYGSGGEQTLGSLALPPAGGNACTPGMIADSLVIGLDGINITGLKLECDKPADIMAAAGPAIHITLPHPGATPASPDIHVAGVGGLAHPIGAGGSGALPAAPVPPPVAGSNVIEGDWNTSEGSMHLEQDGHKLFGTYVQDSGRITAHREGPNWVGDWSEGSSDHRCDKARLGSFYWGRIEFAFTDQNRHFEGVWSYCSAPIAAGKKWTGDRIK